MQGLLADFRGGIWLYSLLALGVGVLLGAALPSRVAKGLGSVCLLGLMAAALSLTIDARAMEASVSRLGWTAVLLPACALYFGLPLLVGVLIGRRIAARCSRPVPDPLEAPTRRP